MVVYQAARQTLCFRTALARTLGLCSFHEVQGVNSLPGPFFAPVRVRQLFMIVAFRTR